MVKHSRWLAAAAWLAVAVVARAGDVVPRTADKAEKTDAGKASPAAAPQENLTTSQQRLASEYKDLEGVLMRMRDLVRPTDPNRASLIEKALKESGDRRVEADFQEIVDLLRQEQLGNAARKQGKVNEDLEAILQLLLSEDYAKRLKERQAEYRKYLQQLNILIRDQSDVQGRTLSGDDPKPLSLEQQALANRTGSLSQGIQQLQQKDRGDAKSDGNKSDGKKGDPNKGDPNKGDPNKGDPNKGDPNKGDPNKGDPNKGDCKSQSGDGKSQSGDGKSQPSDGKKSGKPDGKQPAKPGDKDPKEGKNGEKSDGKGDKGKPEDNKSSERKTGENGKSQQGKSQSSQSQGKGQQGGQQSQGQGQDQDQDSDQSQQQPQAQNAQQQYQDPVRQRLYKAQEHMEQAENRLKKAQKDGAAKEQADALEELKAAKAELEDILRQLREEQMKQLLASLIARMQKVLLVQREIYDGTVRLEKVPVAERSHGHEIESGRLSSRERSIVRDVEEALRLLREEGSAVAMPEALSQVRDDMVQIENRLGQGKTEVLTQAIESDVIKELEEIIDAFKKAKEKAENAKKPPGPSPGDPADPPLIEKLAELKMIRALQLRVNRRTDRYSKLIEPGHEQATKDDVMEALRHLADQQKRVYEITRDLEMGKNE
jgi:hypothetical protein